ncbi:hypothetical protein BC940DRAFT_41681 [Gongronella butleri]|nr:hypothetical protein BC940DRAFT_41681 [Gongronella butleri]
MFQNMGIPPSPRHDHVFAAVGRRLFVVGGRTAREDKDDQDIMHYLDHGIITYPKSENEPAIVPRASSSMPVPRSGKQALEKHLSTSPRSSGSVLTVEPSTSVSASAKAPIRTNSPIRTHSLGASSHISRQGSLRVRRDMISPLQQLIDNTTSNLKNPQVPERQLSGSSRIIVASPSPATTPIPGPLSHNEDDEEDLLLPATLMMNDDDNTSGTGSGLRRDSAYPSSLVVHDLPERKTPQHVQQQKQEKQDDQETDQEQKSHENDHGQDQEQKNHENDAVDASLDVSLSDTPEDSRPRPTAHDSTQPLESKVADASFLPPEPVQQLPQRTEMDTVPQSSTVHAPGQAPMAQNEADELDDATREELLAQIRERDEIIKSMKNTEHWWRTQVSKARGLAPPAPTTKTGVATDESSTKNAQCSLSTGNGDDDAMDAHPDIQLLTFPDDDTPGQSKRLFFEQLIRAKSQARRIRRDIYLTCKPISSKLDHDHRIQQAALEEAKHYKTLCAAILFHRHHSLTSTATNTSTSKTSSTANANANEKEPVHHLDAVMRTSGASHASSLTSGAVDLLEHEMDRRMVRLDQQLQTLLDLGSYTRDRLAEYKDQAEANAQVKSMLTRQVDRGHQKAVFYQDMYESLLKQMLALQRATMQHQFATIRNKYQHKLLQHQMASVQQFDPQPEIRHSLASMSIASGDTTTSSSHRRDSHEPYLDADGWNDLLTHWKAKNKHQQGTIDQLREQLIVSTEVIHQLRMDLICKTNDWRSTLVQLEKVKADIHQLRRTAASSLP